MHEKDDACAYRARPRPLGRRCPTHHAAGCVSHVEAARHTTARQSAREVLPSPSSTNPVTTSSLARPSPGAGESSARACTCPFLPHEANLSALSRHRRTQARPPRQTRYSGTSCIAPSRPRILCGYCCRLKKTGPPALPHLLPDPVLVWSV